MSFNSAQNMGNILSRRINKGITSAVNGSSNSQDLSIRNVRAGWQQRYGAMQLEDVVPNPYALFGGWSGASSTAGP
jgi:hypothetical protein